MAELARDESDVGAGGNQDRGADMPEVVEAERRLVGVLLDAGSFEGSAEVSEERDSVEGLAGVGAEDEACGVRVRLAGLVLAEDVGERVEHDDAAGERGRNVAEAATCGCQRGEMRTQPAENESISDVVRNEATPGTAVHKHLEHVPKAVHL